MTDPDGEPSAEAPAAGRRGGLTGDLWGGIAPIWKAILEHPFVTGLTDGSLERDAFRFYVVQDSHYLREFARALSIAAAKAPADEWIAGFNDHAAGALEVERALHEGFFADFGLSPRQVRATPMAPTCRAYTSYLLSTAYAAPFHEVVGVVLPCYWIYWEVGVRLLEAGSPEPLYQRWIDTYADEEYGELVRAVLDLTDSLGVELPDAGTQAMRRHFETSARYEWMFWEMAWRRERWPV